MKRVFFLVNNHYHRVDMCSHMADLLDCEVNEICIPHSINKKEKVKGVNHFYLFESPFRNRDWLNPFKVNETHRNILSSICIREDDTLILYTEFDPINLFIAAQFSHKGAKVFILEEGVASYLMGSGKKYGEQLSVKEKAKVWVLRHLYGYHFLEYEKLGGVIYYRLQDSMISGVMFYIKYQVPRNIKYHYIYRPNRKKIERQDKKRWVFFSAPLYDRYVNKEEYVSMVCRIAKSIPQDVSLYIRFHPRDSRDVRGNILKKLPDCPVVEDSFTVQEAVEKYKFSMAMSHMSNALFEVETLEVRPVFLMDTEAALRSFTNINLIGDIVKSLGGFSVPRDLSELSLISKVKALPSDRLNESEPLCAVVTGRTAVKKGVW